MNKADMEREIKRRIVDYIEENVIKEVDVLELRDIQEKFLEIVDIFYDSYTGGEYGLMYDRRGSMYKILKVRWSLLEGTTFEFDPSPMSYRSGANGERDLYDLTFVRGWHGGAPKDGSGDPRYRIPQYFINKEPVFTKRSGWGITASRLSPSPLEMMEEWYDEYTSDNTRFDEVLSKHQASIKQIVVDVVMEYMNT